MTCASVSEASTSRWVFLWFLLAEAVGHNCLIMLFTQVVAGRAGLIHMLRQNSQCAQRGVAVVISLANGWAIYSVQQQPS